VVNPKKVVALWLRPDQIGEEVEKLREQYPVCQTLPVNILVFAEHDLKLEFEFEEIRQLGQDALLRSDLKGIILDKEAFKDSNSNRVRFSVAHELGHLYLHKGIYGTVDFQSPEDWKDFFDKIPPEQYQKIEWQADEFAGQLLMPKTRVIQNLEETMEDAEREGVISLGADAVLDWCAKAMHRDFGVSRSAMSTRIRRAKLWPHVKVQD
jgi:hypothetical protein